MNCQTFTRIDTSSLYKNNRLIAQVSVLFLIRNCQDSQINIRKNIFCCFNKRYVRVVFNLSNVAEFDNTVLWVCVMDNCYNKFSKKFIVCRYKNNYYIDLPYPCCKQYLIKARLVQNDILIQEECVTI